VYKRQKEDLRALGEIFFSMYDEVTDIRFSDALSVILSLLQRVLNDSIFLSNVIPVDYRIAVNHSAHEAIADRQCFVPVGCGACEV
jgi:hypothetical protein